MRIIICFVINFICLLCSGEAGKCDVCGSSKGYFSLKVNKSTIYLCTKHICNKHSCAKDKKGICEKCATEINAKKAAQQNARVKEENDKIRNKILSFKTIGNGICGGFKNRAGGMTYQCTPGLFLYSVTKLSVMNSKSKRIYVISLSDIYGNRCFVVCEFKSKVNKAFAEFGIVKIKESVKQALDIYDNSVEFSLSGPIELLEDDVLDLQSKELPNYMLDLLWNIDSTVVFDNITLFKATKKIGCYKTIVNAKLDDYYNYCYADCEDTHVSVRLYEEENGSLYGYANRKSNVGEKLYSLLKDGKEHKIEVYVCHPISMVMDWKTWESETVDIVSFKEKD